MSVISSIENLEVGFDVPALPGMSEKDIQTPCLMIDLDALEKNIKAMGLYCKTMNIRHRIHGKMHKSVEIALLQKELGNSCGVFCQKVSEAEVFARGGIKDILVSNQIRDPKKIDRMAQLPKLGTRTICCVDDIDNVEQISKAAQKHSTEIECLVEIDCGAGRCGVEAGQPVVEIAKSINEAPHLKFSGIQAYQGAMQHMQNYNDRKMKIDIAIDLVAQSIEMLMIEGLECDIVGGGGTGSYYFEGNSGVYNELQCGSYAFMDADYQTIHDKNGRRISEFDNALFILTSIMSHVKKDKAICDAGLKAQSVDSGLPYIFERNDVEYIKCSDEHGVIDDPNGALKINEKIRLVPGHCDPTCNVHDYYVGVRNGVVETLWPVSARGKAY